MCLNDEKVLPKSSIIEKQDVADVRAHDTLISPQTSMFHIVIEQITIVIYVEVSIKRVISFCISNSA